MTRSVMVDIARVGGLSPSSVAIGASRIGDLTTAASPRDRALTQRASRNSRATLRMP